MESRLEHPHSARYSDVTAELTEMSLRGLLPTVILGVVGLVGSTSVVAMHYHDPVMWGLAALAALLGIIRTRIMFRLEKSLPYRQLFLARKLHQHFLNIVLLCYYGIMVANTLWNFHQHRPPAQMLCIIGIFIFCNGINGRIGASPHTAKLHGLVMLLVLAYCIWNPHDEFSWAAEGMLAMFAVAHCRAVQEKFDIVVEQIRNQRKLRMLSERDPLTGLLNRRGFCTALDDLCSSGTTFAILFIDLDRFKPVNDLYGHAVGDEVLFQVGERLVSIVRAEDIVARLGGDEFAILQLPVTQRSNAEGLAERVTFTLSRPFDTGHHRVTIGASVGITLPWPGEAKTESLLKRADDALYLAKQDGRGRFVFAEPNEVVATRP